MGGVIDIIDCPNCKNENCNYYSNYKLGEESLFCGDCGYKHSIIYERTEEGELKLIDPEKGIKIDNLIPIETLISNPYGVFSIENKEEGAIKGTLETEEDYFKFLQQIENDSKKEHNIKRVIISRLIKGKIEKETIL